MPSPTAMQNLSQSIGIFFGLRAYYLLMRKHITRYGIDIYNVKEFYHAASRWSCHQK